MKWNRFVCATLAVYMGAAALSAAIINVPADQATVSAAVGVANAAGGDTINVTAPVTEAATLSIAKQVQIELNGNTWTVAGATGVTFAAASAGCIINNGTILGAASVTNNLLNFQANGTLTGVTLSAGASTLRLVQLNIATLTATNCVFQNALQVGIRVANSGSVLNLTNCTFSNNATTAYTTGSGYGQLVLNAVTPLGGSVTLNNCVINRGTSAAPAINVGNGATSTNTLVMTGGSIYGGAAGSANGIIRNVTTAAAEGGLSNITLDNVKVSNIGTGPAVILDKSKFTAQNGTVLGVSETPDNNGHVISLSGTPTVTLTNCDLTTHGAGSYASVFPSAIFAGGGTVTATNTDFRIPGGGSRITNFSGNLMTFTGCTVAPASGGAGALTGNGDLSLVNCSISSGGNIFGSNFVGSPTINITNPTVIGGCGAIMFTNTASATINLRGTSAAAKLNLDNFVTNGTILFGRINAGGFGFYDCTLSNNGIYRLVDANGLTLAGNIALNFDRCLFTNGTGKISADDAGTPAFGFTLSALNTVWAGFTDDVFRFSPFPATHTGPDNFNLTHCTLLGVARPGGVSQMINAAGSPAGSVMNLNYSVVDAATAAYPAVFSGAGAGTQNVINLPTVDVAFPNNLTGTIAGNPGFTAAGIPQVPTSAIVYTAPSTSTTPVDVLGNSRPGGTGDLDADPGAYEEMSQVPVELSTFSLE